MGVVVDWRDTPIKIGSTVVYPSRQGSRLWMTEGVVKSIDDKRIGVIKRGSARTSYPDPMRITVMA